MQRKNAQFLKLAEKHIIASYRWKSTILPCLLILTSFVFVVFIFLQFIFTDKPWNFAVLFYNWASSTYFGQKVGDFVYSIDAVVFAILWFLLKKFYRNPLSKKLRQQYKKELIEAYIKEIEEDPS